MYNAAEKYAERKISRVKHIAKYSTTSSSVSSSLRHLHQ
jgi:hypothetical protein